MTKKHTTTLFDLLVLGDTDICPEDVGSRSSDALALKVGSSSEVFQTQKTARNPHTGRASLHEAAANGDHTAVRHLIENGTDVGVNKPTFLGGDTALHIATSREHPNVIKEIMRSHGADPNIRNKYRATPLHCAKSREIAELLLSYGATLDLVDCNNNTALQLAVARPTSARNSELIQYLTELTEEQTRAQIRKELNDNRERRRRAEAIKAEQREREEAERVKLLNSRLLSEYKNWRGRSK